MKIEHIEIHESEHDLSEHVFCGEMNNLSAVEKETDKNSGVTGNRTLIFALTGRNAI